VVSAARRPVVRPSLRPQSPAVRVMSDGRADRERAGCGVRYPRSRPFCVSPLRCATVASVGGVGGVGVLAPLFHRSGNGFVNGRRDDRAEGGHQAAG
jgi:hypothetical protein